MRRLIVGMSGATGSIYGIRILQVLARMPDVETHLVMSKAAKMTVQVETPHSVKEVEELADVVHDINNIGASIASGSFRTAGDGHRAVLHEVHGRHRAVGGRRPAGARL